MADHLKTSAPAASEPRPGGGTTGPMSACSRCRKQKLKCSRDQPACRRCQNLRIACYYPPPPDRKLLASLRTTSSKKRLRESSDKQQHEDLQGQPSSSSTPTDAKQSSSISFGDLHEDISFSPPTDIGDPRWPHPGIGAEPPRSQQSLQPQPFSSLAQSFLPNMPQGREPTVDEGLVLIDIYFARIYFAPQLINKKILVDDYLAKRAAPFVVLSVFALASIFLLDNPEAPPIPEAARLPNARDLALIGNEWAETANILVLQKADQPAMETVQASQNLGLYWFSRNQVRRTDMHSRGFTDLRNIAIVSFARSVYISAETMLTYYSDLDIAYRSCRLLGYDKLLSVVEELGAAETERRRRCFWSIWGMSCISQEHASFKGRPWAEVAGLPLVSDEASYFAGNPISRERFDEEGNVEDIVPEGGITKDMDLSLVAAGDAPTFSLYAEMAKLLGLWWEIHMFTKGLTAGVAGRTVDHVSLLYKLDQRLTIIMNGLPEELKYPPGFRFSNYGHDPHKFFGLHSLYYQSRCVLHSSIVPVFSGTENKDPKRCIPDELVKLSARAAMRYSSEYVGMAMDYLSINPDVSRCWGFIGFSVFVCTSIQLTFWSFHGDFLLKRGDWRVFAVLSILRTVKKWWAPLERLWVKLKTMSQYIETHVHPNTINAARAASESSERSLSDEGLDEKSKLEYNSILESVVAACRSGQKKDAVTKLGYVPGDLIEHEEASKKDFDSTTSADDTESIARTPARPGYTGSNAPPVPAKSALSDGGSVQQADTLPRSAPTSMNMVMNTQQQLAPSGHPFSHMGGGVMPSAIGMPPDYTNFALFNTNTNPSAHLFSTMVMDQQIGTGGAAGYTSDPSAGADWYNQTLPGLEGDYFAYVVEQQLWEQSQGLQHAAGLQQHQPQQHQRQNPHPHPHSHLQPQQMQDTGDAGDGGAYQPG